MRAQVKSRRSMPDHPGEPLGTAEMNAEQSERANPSHLAPRRANEPAATGELVQAAMRQGDPPPSVPQRPATPQPALSGSTGSLPSKLPVKGTVVLDVEPGGIEVPSFVGKTVRGAVEAAQDVGLQLEAVGSGVARQQSPPAGTRVAAGSRVTVQFGP